MEAIEHIYSILIMISHLWFGCVIVYCIFYMYIFELLIFYLFATFVHRITSIKTIVSYLFWYQIIAVSSLSYFESVQRVEIQIFSHYFPDKVWIKYVFMKFFTL